MAGGNISIIAETVVHSKVSSANGRTYAPHWFDDSSFCCRNWGRYLGLQFVSTYTFS